MKKEAHLQNDYEAVGSNFFPRTCCADHIKLDKRTPGLFKVEAEGDEMICLCSKTYLLKTNDDMKFSCKGINKKHVQNIYSTYLDVLQNEESASGVNKGIRARNNTMYTYTQERKGFSYFYCKRKVQNDKISTDPLDIVLTPWDLPDRFIYTRNHPLCLHYKCTIKIDDQIFYTAYEAYRNQ